MKEGIQKIPSGVRAPVDSIQPTSISIDTFYKSLSFYNIKMNFKPGRRPQTQDEATIIQLISDIRKSGIIVGIK